MSILPIFKSKRKIQGLGSSLAITLPSFFVKANEVEKGLELKVHYNLKGLFIVSKNNDSLSLTNSLKDIRRKLEQYCK